VIEASRTVYEIGRATADSDDPVFRDERARMFRRRFFEFFSRVHPAVPAAIFVPVVAAFAWAAAGELEAAAAVGLLLAGGAVWTLAEYLLHRFVFHVPRRGPLTRWMYTTFHGVHHMYPDDALRLVMVPAVSIPLAFLFYGAFAALLPAAWAAAAFSGFTLGYLVYDYSHFATHFVRPPRAWWLAPVARVMMEQRKRHMRHHFGDHESGFGVSTGLWDRVFGTEDGRG